MVQIPRSPPTNCYKKDVMPTNGCIKPFVGINFVKKQSLRSAKNFDTKVDLNYPISIFSVHYNIKEEVV